MNEAAAAAAVSASTTATAGEAARGSAGVYPVSSSTHARWRPPSITYVPGRPVHPLKPHVFVHQRGGRRERLWLRDHRRFHLKTSETEVSVGGRPVEGDENQLFGSVRIKFSVKKFSRSGTD